jgi:lipopolysaccharide export system permease protein
MPILHRYILREIASHFVAVTGVLSVILVSYRIAKVLDLAANNQLSQTVVWQLVGLMSLTELTVLMPIGLFLGTMLALGRLYHDSEIAAVQSCGIGPRKLLRPVLALTVLVAMVLGWLSFTVAPQIQNHAQRIRMTALSQARLSNIAPQQFAPFADAIYYAESVDSNGVLYNVFVQRRDGDKVQVIVADRAEQRGAGALDQAFVLYQGTSYAGVPGKGEFSIIRFAQLDYPFRLPAPGDWSMRVEGLATRDLWASDNPEQQAELQSRLAVPIMAVVLALCAVPLSKLRPRQGRYAKMGWGLLAYFTYQIGLLAAQTWMEKRILPADLGFWWVHVLALAIVGAWIFKLDPLHQARSRAAVAT